LLLGATSVDGEVSVDHVGEPALQRAQGFFGGLALGDFARRSGNETVFAVARAVILVAGAMLLGFRFHGTATDAVAALVVLAVLAGAMSALFGRLGDRLRRPDVVQFAGMW
jgi:hypothetical protein